jgi:hypothetical protein
MAKFLAKPIIGKNGGDEGGEILLEKADTNTSIAGTGVTIDIYQNKLRFFEQGGDARGAYIDITAASNGVGSNLLAGGGGGATTLDGLTDVVVSTPLPYQGLMYDGTNWVNSNIPNTYLVRNNTGSTLLKGTLVSASGSEPSGRIDVEPHETTGLQDSELRVMGIVTANISDGVNGEVMSFGTLTNVDTRGNVASALAVGDETWAAGDILYAHPTVAGKLTNVRPTHDLAVAFITIRHASSGQIAIRIIPGNHHLEWMHDVSLSSPASGDFLKYNGTLWVNDPINLGTDTTGDYVASLVAGTGITLSNNSGEGSTPTIALSDVVTNAQTATYTLALSDKNKMIEMNVGSANIVYVPTNASVQFPVGSTIDILQTGSGKTQIAASSSGTTTINSASGFYLRAQWSSATLIKRATDTWVVVGDLATS